MKKKISSIIFLIIAIVLSFSIKAYAVSLDNIHIDVSSSLVRPGDEVSVNINFGQELGSYTFDVAYDNNIFEYISSEGGTANDTGDKVRVVFFDSTGGTNPSSSMSVKFRAKENITTSNPTEFTVLAEGLANSDATITFDDITVPIVKNVTVEPEYVDYTLVLENTGSIVKGEEKEMKLKLSSPMGRYYEHARILAYAETPEGANVKLFGYDQEGLEYDIIQTGWGNAQGYGIGGKNYTQSLILNGIFSQAGDYKINLKLIDRDNSDNVIVSNSFDFKVDDTTVMNTTNEGKVNENKVTESKNDNKNKNTVAPKSLPKAGRNMYVPIVILCIACVGLYIYINKKLK